tara:strand:- start:1480 stop:2598 length:1119 start_codon:yes stop_codon:yes gene_type:complete
MNRYNFNNLKNFLANNSVASIISLLALFIAISSSQTPCLSANSVCTAGTDPEYTNNISVKAGTTNKATFTHNNLNGDNQYFFPESNYSRTSSVAILKKGTDQLNILDLQNGSIIIGQSQSTTIGNLRVQTSTSPVLQMYGSAGWQDVGAVTPDQNVFTTINGNTGSLTASTTQTLIKIEASADSGLTVVASGDKLEIQSAGGGGGYEPKCSYFVYSANSQTPSNPNGNNFDSEYYDFDNCYTLSSSSAGSTITYTDSTTRVFEFYYQLALDTSHSNSNYYIIALQVGRNQPSSPVNWGRIANQFNTSISSKPENASGIVCLEQNKDFELGFPAWTNGVVIYGGKDFTYLTLNELPELSAQAQSSGCTNGEIN